MWHDGLSRYAQISIDVFGNGIGEFFSFFQDCIYRRAGGMAFGNAGHRNPGDSQGFKISFTLPKYSFHGDSRPVGDWPYLYHDDRLAFSSVGFRNGRVSVTPGRSTGHQTKSHFGRISIRRILPLRIYGSLLWQHHTERTEPRGGC